jgi:hypothetical protein
MEDGVEQFYADRVPESQRYGGVTPLLEVEEPDDDE